MYWRGLLFEAAMRFSDRMMRLASLPALPFAIITREGRSYIPGFYPSPMMIVEAHPYEWQADRGGQGSGAERI